MDSKKEIELNKIQSSLKEILETDEVPPFEVNDETISILQRIIENCEEKKRQNEIIAQQRRRETEELIADKRRMNKVLTSLDLDPANLPPKTKNLLKSLAQAMDSLEVANSSLPMLIVSVTELQDDVNKSSMDIEMLEENCRALSGDCKEAKDLLTSLQKQYSELESQLPNEQKNVESLQKSGKFHRQKKKQYEGMIEESTQRLREANFQPQVSHEAINKLGKKAAELDAKLKPLLLQLDSYKQLPPDANLARLKLCEVLNELKQVEAELHDVFQDLRLST